MSCAVMLAASLLLADPAAAAQPAVAVETTIAAEPLFSEIVSHSLRLKAVVDGWIAGGAAEDAAFTNRPEFATFQSDIQALAALDMRGHVELRERNTDGDLKCILRGLSEDIPRRVEALTTAAEPRARADALGELSYLLDDNAAVIMAPPQPGS